MPATKEALFYDRLPGGAVRCRLCAQECTIASGARGLCAVRENVSGTLTNLVYGRLVAQDVDPIEKKPLYHFLPGTRAYSIAAVGCNFVCANCQNHMLSQWPRQPGGTIVGDEVSPDDVVEAAVAAGCRSIAYTYSEPTVAVEYHLDVMRRARAAGLANVWVSNGYFSRDAAADILPLVDALNIDLKGITDAFYRDVAGARVRPVLDSIARAVDAGVWVEVTTLVIPGANDGVDELRQTARGSCRDLAGGSVACQSLLSRVSDERTLPDADRDARACAIHRKGGGVELRLRGQRAGRG